MIACIVSRLDLVFHVKCAFGLHEWFIRAACVKIPFARFPMSKLLALNICLAVLGAKGRWRF